MRKLLTILSAIFLSLSLAGQASAFSVSGGTVEQRKRIIAAVNAAQFPPVAWVDEHYIGGVDIEIVEHFEPYWQMPLAIDLGPAALGAAWAGEIRIMAALAADEWLTEVAVHEWAHQVWIALPSAANTEWRIMATDQFPDYDPSVWMQNPAENHAENLRVAAWSSEWWVTNYPRTDLRRFTTEVVREWHARWITTTTLPEQTTTTTVPPPPPTTTTTIARGDPFFDVARDDTELWESGWWAKDRDIVNGYTDGTLGKHMLLSHRHLALIVDRWVGIGLPASWADDWSPVTRAETRDALPGLLWLEARWDEPLTRGQMVRLMWRAR